MLGKLTLKKKFSLILFLLNLIKQVYVCLTTTNCNGCVYESLCDDADQEICNLINGIATRIFRYYQKKEA